MGTQVVCVTQRPRGYPPAVNQSLRLKAQPRKGYWCVCTILSGWTATPLHKQKVVAKVSELIPEKAVGMACSPPASGIRLETRSPRQHREPAECLFTHAGLGSRESGAFAQDAQGGSAPEDQRTGWAAVSGATLDDKEGTVAIAEGLSQQHREGKG